MTGDAILLMLLSILVIWGGLCGSLVALKVMVPPYQKGEDYSEVEVAKPHPGLTEADFTE